MSVIFSDRLHDGHWTDYMVYRSKYVGGFYEWRNGALVRSHAYSNIGKGQTEYCEVAVWSRWVGQPFENSAKWFESQPKGGWSDSKPGPAFEFKPVDGSYERPVDRAKCVVFSKPGPHECIGIYRADFDALCNEDGCPVAAFADWTEFRVMDSESGKTGEMKTGPSFEGWKQEEHERKVEAARSSNQAVFDDWNGRLKSIQDPDSKIRLARVRRLLTAAETAPFDTSLDPPGRGDELKEKLLEGIEEELSVIEESLTIRNFPSYPYSQRELYELIDQFKLNQISYDTFTRGIRRKKSIEGIDLEIDPRGNISRKSFLAVKNAIGKKLKDKAGWASNV